MDTKASSESKPYLFDSVLCHHHSFTSKNYVNTSAPDYTYYVRKHNPTIIYDSVASVPSRLALHRNFNDLAADVNASALPQWVFITPNMVDDGHDTSINYTASWLQFWLVPLLSNKNFNDDKTLIVLSFDENESYTENNCVLTLLLGGAVPDSVRGTTDSTYYTHYSLLSTVQANWGLGSLGRGDTNKSVFRCSFLAAVSAHMLPRPTGPSRTSSPSSQMSRDIQTLTFPAPITPQTPLARYPARSTPGYTCPSLRRTRPPSVREVDPSSSPLA